MRTDIQACLDETGIKLHSQMHIKVSKSFLSVPRLLLLEASSGLRSLGAGRWQHTVGPR